MEFLNLVIILAIGIFLLRRPQMERIAFRLLVLSIVLMMFLFAVGTRTSLLPGVNY